MTSRRSINPDDITLELLQSYYDVPLADLAKELKISLTLLKKICRKFGIQRWPHRQIRSINRNSKEIKARIRSALSSKERADLEAQLDLVEKKRRLIIRSASSGLQPKLRNAIFLASPRQFQKETVFSDLVSSSSLSDTNSPICSNEYRHQLISPSDSNLLAAGDLLPPFDNRSSFSRLSPSVEFQSQQLYDFGRDGYQQSFSDQFVHESFPYFQSQHQQRMQEPDLIEPDFNSKNHLNMSELATLLSMPDDNSLDSPTEQLSFSDLLSQPVPNMMQTGSYYHQNIIDDPFTLSQTLFNF